MITTDLCDEFSDVLQVAKPIFRHFGGKKQFCGPIHTVEVFNDNVLVKEALETIPSGAVLVVDGKGSDECALLGDRLAKIAVDRGIEGIIIHGYVRDSVEISKLPIGVCALGTMPLKSKKNRTGLRNSSLQFANVNWIPNHYVYGDEDGLIVSQTVLK
ncbi:MAG: ribonuclease E activity regulator RraA [Bacillaceae bacterium]